MLRKLNQRFADFARAYPERGYCVHCDVLGVMFREGDMSVGAFVFLYFQTKRRKLHAWLTFQGLLALIGASAKKMHSLSESFYISQNVFPPIIPILRSHHMHCNWRSSC